MRNHKCFYTTRITKRKKKKKQNIVDKTQKAFFLPRAINKIDQFPEDTFFLCLDESHYCCYNALLA